MDRKNRYIPHVEPDEISSARREGFREKFRANLAKDILLTIMRGNGIPPLPSPQGATSFCSLMVDYALQVTEYFMFKVFGTEEEGAE